MGMNEEKRQANQRERAEKPVFVKKQVLYGILGIVGLILLLILLGLNSLNHRNMSKNKEDEGDKMKHMADNSYTDWYKDQEAKALASNKQNVSQQTAGNAKPLNTSTSEGAFNFPQNNTPQDSKTAETLDKAMKAPISAQQINSPNLDNVTQHQNEGNAGNSSTNDSSGPVPNNDQNMQSEKKAFLKINGEPNLSDYLSSTVQKPLTQYELQAGTIIPGILITGINSDLPGQITGQVRSNIYDSISGKYLLVPQGAKVVGVYDSQVAYGQERVLIAWRRIIFPNGQSIDLEGMPGVDVSGYAGFNDQVNNHYFKIFGSVILMSLLSAGAQLTQPQNQNANIFTMNNPTVGQTVAQSLGTNISNTAIMLTQKNINIQPTLEIRPGYEFNISVTKDMVFPSPYTS